MKLNLKVSKTIVGKSEMTSGNKIKVYITNRRNNKRCWFYYNDNYLNQSNEKDFLVALYMDAISSNGSLYDFIKEFGYDLKKGVKVYKECLKSKMKYEKLFNTKEQRLIENMANHY